MGKGDEIPPVPGAYVLLIELSRALAVPLGGGRRARLGPGLYAYCGSARGPAGIRGRAARHLKRAKRPHWHVDRLTQRGLVTEVLAVPGGAECALADAVAALPGSGVPAPGFGASDCRRCAAHLFSLSPAGRRQLLAGEWAVFVTA